MPWACRGKHLHDRKTSIDYERLESIGNCSSFPQYRLPTNHKLVLYIFSQGRAAKGTGLFNERKLFSTHLSPQVCSFTHWYENIYTIEHTYTSTIS